MKKSTFIVLILSIMAVFTLSSCGHHVVEAGYVGVKVNRMGSEKGVEEKVLSPGRYFPTINEDIFDYPTFQVNYVFCRDTTEASPTNEEFVFQTIEGMECSLDLGVSMHFDVDKIPHMFQTYRKGVDEIRSVVVRKEIRDALNRVGGTMPVESVYGAGKGKLIDTVFMIVKNKLDPDGIIIDGTSLIGSIRIPGSIIDALNAKVQMNQEAERARNEIAKAEAQAKTLLVRANAEAEANRIRQAALTDKLLMQQWIEAWRAGGSQVPSVVGNSPTMYQLPAFK